MSASARTAFRALGYGVLIVGSAIAIFNPLSRSTYLVATFGLLVLYILLCVGIPFAKADRVGFLSVSGPPLLAGFAAIFMPTAARGLHLAAWLYLGFFILGGRGWWSLWSRFVLRRGRSKKDRLKRAYFSVIERAKRSDLTERDFRRLRDDIVRLDRFRNDDTDAFIGLAQAQLLDWADQREVPTDEAARRDRLILELGNQLWLTPASGSTDVRGRRRRSTRDIARR